MNGSEFVPLSLVPMLTGIFVAVACALPGNFLVLRRQALIGDAISHVVLPGIVVAFLLTGVVSTWPMLLGAAGAALVAVLAIEGVRRLGKIESGAAMGVVFTAMFAGGVLLLEQSDTSNVHLDVEHALYGDILAVAQDQHLRRGLRPYHRHEDRATGPWSGHRCGDCRCGCF